jgi:hypothetical protein
MWRWLDSIRQKPKVIRNQYAFGIAVTFTGVIVAVWTFSLPARFSDTPNDIAKAPFAGIAGEVASGFGAIKSQVASVMSAKEMFQAPSTEATSTEPATGLPEAYELWTDIGEAASTTPAPAVVEIRVATSSGTSSVSSTSPSSTQP